MKQEDQEHRILTTKATAGYLDRGTCRQENQEEQKSPDAQHLYGRTELQDLLNPLTPPVHHQAVAKVEPDIKHEDPAVPMQDAAPGTQAGLGYLPSRAGTSDQRTITPQRIGYKCSPISLPFQHITTPKTELELRSEDFPTSTPSSHYLNPKVELGLKHEISLELLQSVAKKRKSVFKCEIPRCSAAPFRYAWELDAHLEIHRPIRRVVTFDLFKAGMVIQKDDDIEMLCPFCPAYTPFRKTESFQSHIKNDHFNVNKDERSKLRRYLRRGKNVEDERTCTLCGEICTNLSVLGNHSKAKHSEAMVMLENPCLPDDKDGNPGDLLGVRCPFCEHKHRYKRRRTLNTHVVLEHPTKIEVFVLMVFPNDSNYRRDSRRQFGPIEV